jgi:O-antigen/teichoic acid export membrane protein
VLLIVFRFVYGITDVSAYMYSYGLSYVLSFVLSFYYVLQRVRYMGFSGIFVLLGAMFKYGFFIQVANFSQLLNYRLSYYVITFVSGARPLGLFDCGTKLSEAVWVFPKSISTVLYTRISNCGADNAYAKRVTLSFLKLSFVFAVTAIVLLFCVPSSWLGFIFGGEFVDSKEIIYALGGGIIVLSCNMILSHYFSGLGKYTVNTIASVVGLVVTGGLSLLLIFLVDGDTVSGLELIFLVGLVTSLSYLSSFVYTFICFARDAKLKLKELQISRQDMLVVKTALKKGFGRMRNRKYAFHATPKKR